MVKQFIFWMIGLVECIAMEILFRFAGVSNIGVISAIFMMIAFFTKKGENN